MYTGNKPHRYTTLSRVRVPVRERASAPSLLCLLYTFGLRTCLTFTSLASARMLNASVRLARSTSQRHAKMAFILPLMICHSFHLAQSLTPHLVRVLAQHGPTPILRAAGTALATGTLPLISLWVSGLILFFSYAHVCFFVFAFTPVPACPRFPAHARPPAPPCVHPLRLCPPARTCPRALSCCKERPFPLRMVLVLVSHSPVRPTSFPFVSFSFLSPCPPPLCATVPFYVAVCVDSVQYRTGQFV